MVKGDGPREALASALAAFSGERGRMNTVYEMALTDAETIIKNLKRRGFKIIRVSKTK